MRVVSVGVSLAALTASLAACAPPHAVNSTAVVCDDKAHPGCADANTTVVIDNGTVSP